ncbi:MAG: suppressor of fused domain protein [Planctomycetota bacterium]
MARDDLHESADIVRHKKPKERGFELAHGDEALINAVTEHFTRHIGEPEHVYHEMVSDLIHLDVHFIPPSNEHPYYTAFTTGMAERAMQAPEGAEEFTHAELMIKLPETWRTDFTDEFLELPEAEQQRHFWPIGVMKTLARFPHEYQTWLYSGHTVPNGDPPAPFADDTQMACALLTPPMIESEDFGTVELADGRRVFILQLLPIGAGETEYKLRNGVETLIDLFQEQGVGDVVDPGRPDVSGLRARRRRKKFLGLF